MSNGWDSKYWETRPGHWGSPGIFLPPPLANMGGRYPLNPEWLQRMMQIPVIPQSPYEGAYAGYDRTANALYLPGGIEPWAALHEYGHALEPPEWADAFRRLNWAAPWDIPELAEKYGPASRESYAWWPPVEFEMGRPMPDYLKRYYPWINW